eukprot:CAMPEP_0181505122 /NCGR_PEP_ID=MMETSP1110-20121109/57888_1 /TAXON_ID=174948 /ORGANISM="Symbiodinium sp., Strain CCMP421" /LENGTH=134 /DNA_ID=CAMNT_0023634083 /DNA_START=298 /DNA_END=702 /DNA_ORIENTATION=+
MVAVRWQSSAPGDAPEAHDAVSTRKARILNARGCMWTQLDTDDRTEIDCTAPKSAFEVVDASSSRTSAEAPCSRNPHAAATANADETRKGVGTRVALESSLVREEELWLQHQLFTGNTASKHIPHVQLYLAVCI